MRVQDASDERRGIGQSGERADAAADGGAGPPAGVDNSEGIDYATKRAVGLHRIVLRSIGGPMNRIGRKKRFINKGQLRFRQGF
ncbi:MAG: hypothetical protein NC254_14350 [bacterium]|nr:hypothetical protein [bacterium]